MAKNLMRKAKHSGEDVWLSVLEYRNTPSQGMNNSPVQRLMSRRTRTPIPTKATLMKAEVQVDVAD